MTVTFLGTGSSGCLQAAHLVACGLCDRTIALVAHFAARKDDYPVDQVLAPVVAQTDPNALPGFCMWVVLLHCGWLSTLFAGLLNLSLGVLVYEKKAEAALEASSILFVIVRPGGCRRSQTPCNNCYNDHQA